MRVVVVSYTPEMCCVKEMQERGDFLENYEPKPRSDCRIRRYCTNT